jgi:hypothetical protein
VGAVCAAQFANTINSKLPVSSLSPQTQNAIPQMKKRTLVTNAREAAPAERARVHAALQDASVKAFHIGIGIGGLLAIAGGLVSLVGLEGRPRREVKAEGCPGGAICGAPEEVRVGQAGPQLTRPSAAARAG